MATVSSEPSAPSLSTTETDYKYQEINADTIALGEAEQENEIVALNDTGGKWILDVGDAFHKQWKDIQNAFTASINTNDNSSLDGPIDFEEDKVFVISLLGNTSSGKSFLAKHLFSDSENNETAAGPVCIDEAEKKGATTGNINCYLSRSAKNNKTLLLDYEGEKGSAFPLLLYARRGWAHITGSADKAQQRRQAITDYFPKLAYILSDVVILLGNDDLASTDYLTRCREFALKANDGVNQMPHRPVLIIVQNKCSFVQSVASEDVTQKFFGIHGPEADTLKNYFSDIRCFCLPHTEQLQRSKNGILDGREIYDRQMTDLKKQFEIVYRRNSERSLTHAQWLYLLQRVLEIVQSGKSVSLHTLLSEIFAHDDNETIETAIRSFLIRYKERDIHSPQWFTDCCQFALRVLAHCMAVKAYNQRELMSERIIHEQCENALKALCAKLDQFRPCEALYTGKGRSSKSKDNEYAIFCYQHKGAHEGGHRTCQPVYGLTQWKEFWNWSSTDVWPGEFVLSANEGQDGAIVPEEMINDLLRMVRELMAVFQQDPKTVYLKFIHLFCDCRNIQQIEIFQDICFCVPKASPVLTAKSCAQIYSPAQRRLLLMRRVFLQLQFQMVQMVALSSGSLDTTCAICYNTLMKICDEVNCESSLVPPTSSISCPDSAKDQPVCAICFDENRNFLFIPCGHRGFCEKCTDSVLTTQGVCPICRASITGKQRVHDV